MRSIYAFAALFFCFQSPLWAGIQGLPMTQLSGIDSQSRKQAKNEIRKIQVLLNLQKKEREAGLKRMGELEKTVGVLEARQAVLKEKVDIQKRVIRHYLSAIELSSRGDLAESIRSLHLPDQEKLEAPRRRVLTKLVDRGLKEVEGLKAASNDALLLEGRIAKEKQQLSYLFQELKEQETVLELNRQLQLDFLKQKRKPKVAQIEHYQRLRSAAAQVENLIGGLDVQAELARAEFSKLKGKLSFPVVGGKVVSAFGRSFDPDSGLYIFKKGVDLATRKRESVQAISSGKIAYAGKLPQYGQVVIVDHGDHFYSLCGNLGKISKKANDPVVAGESIGLTNDSGIPLYFEIRTRNVAVNPLQWVFN